MEGFWATLSGGGSKNCTAPETIADGKPAKFCVKGHGSRAPQNFYSRDRGAAFFFFPPIFVKNRMSFEFFSKLPPRRPRAGNRPKKTKKSKIFIFAKSIPNHIPMIVGGVWRWETRCLGCSARNCGFIWAVPRGSLGISRHAREEVGAREVEKPKKIENFNFSQIDPKSCPDDCLRCLEVGNAFFWFLCAPFGVHLELRGACFGVFPGMLVGPADAPKT